MNIQQKEFYKLSGQRIMELRQMNMLSREVLAEISQISPKFLYEIEMGKKGFSAYTLAHLTKALEIRSDYVIIGDQRTGDTEMPLASIELFDKSQHAKIDELLKKIYEIKILNTAF